MTGILCLSNMEITFGIHFRTDQSEAQNSAQPSKQLFPQLYQNARNIYL